MIPTKSIFQKKVGDLMASYVQGDCLINHTPSSAVAAGGVVILNDLVTVAPVAIAANALGAVAVEGVWNMPKASGAIGQGALVYWDSTNSNITTTSAGNKRAGKAAAAAASGDTSVSVLINIG
jgi:predicted RecA/RadA family phage recombinase